MSTRLLAVGDNVVDRYVELGFMYPGGNAVNVAVHARRVGSQAAYLGVLGSDQAGQAVLAALRAEQVDTTLTRVVQGDNASADVRVVDGNRVFGVGRPGVSRFVLSADDLAAAATFDIVHTGECSSLEDQLPALASAATRLSFDFSERPWDYVAQHAAHVDIAIASSPSGDRGDAEARADAIRALGPDVVAVTLGAAGAVLSVGDELHFAPAGAVRVVDTLGAGDAFIARLLHGLLTREPPQQLLSAATAYASAACAGYGAFGYQTALTDSPEPTPEPTRKPTPDHQALSGTARWETA
jgi:sugar/nucleoside kinase (ribokinase family)